MQNEKYAPEVIVETSGLTEEEWLEYRRQGIGGSDAAALMGVSPFATARDLYYDKLKIVSYKDDDSNWVEKRIGHLLEDLVAEIFCKKTDYHIYQIHKMFRHPVYSFMLADIDYFITLPNGETAILEIKTTNYNAKDKWWFDGKKTVPVNYEIQGRHYMTVMDLDHVFYCCLYGNNEDEVIIRHIERDKAYEDELIALESDFWNNYIQKKIPPPYTEDGEMILRSVRSHFGPADTNAPQVELSLSQASCVSRFLELQAQKKIADEQSKKLGNEMKRLQGHIVSEMGRSCTAACFVDGNSYTITYNSSGKPIITKDNLARLRAQHPDIYDEYVTVSESRRFYVKKSHETAA